MILGLVGEKFAGKDEVAKYLEVKKDFGHIRFSHIFDEILNILQISISRENEIKLGNGIRMAFGEGVFVPAVVKRMQENSKNMWVVNGIRLKEEFDSLKELGCFFLYITAPAELRFQRYLTRDQKADDGSLDFSGFLEMEKGHTEVLIPDQGKICDRRIDNNGSLQELYKKLEDILAEKATIGQ